MSHKRLISADMTMAEVLQKYPEVETTLVQYKLHCVDCEVSSLESIDVAAQTHGIKDLNKLLDDLNSAIK
ncbi:DUF1858 domain-containing protein [bacterium]|nr:DUF1858 domain-containing protein [bacterium]MBU1651047.1 DUF1858 domain-containing protein [bacterium]MBU1882327.1 DUF1858 domain-containing protein [bacterium]